MSILPLILAFILQFFPYKSPPPAKPIILEMPKPELVADTTPWGTTAKLEEHIYRTYVGNDPRMGTPEEILTALNYYRRTHGTGELQSDQKLCDLAQQRADDQAKEGDLDKHQGLIEYMEDSKRWEELGITAIGENSSAGYVLTGVHLIEWVFDADEEHRNNQLSPEWNLTCAAISNTTVDIIFGKR